MPSPTPDMRSVMDYLRLAELDEDILCSASTTTLANHAEELLLHESTSHLERLLLTITIGMVNQNAILIRQMEGLKEEQLLASEKTASQLAAIANKVDRAHDRISALPRTNQTTATPQATAPPNNPPATQQAQRHTQAQPRSHQQSTAPPPPAIRADRVILQETPSYAQIAQENLHQWEQASRKRTPAKKTKAKETGPKPLPAVQRRFFATRLTPEPIESPDTLAAELSVTFGKFMASQNQVAPVTALTVTINQRGAVTVLPAPTVPSSVYAPFFEAMTAILNNRIKSEHNPFNNFRPAPTDVDIAIHGIPLFDLATKEDLNAKFPEIFFLASGIAPIATRFVHLNDSERNSRKTSTVVITVSASDAALIGPSIRILSRPRKCTVMWSTSPITQCKKCYKFGHPEQGCKQEHPTCPICAKRHTKQEHTCPASCAGPRLRATGCCAAVRPKCINCDGGHASTSNACPALTALIENNKPKRAPASAPQPPPPPHQPTNHPRHPCRMPTQLPHPLKHCRQ